jgi:2-C-methyl-D-erythritol 4-phosphate cytidylyltransferase
VLIVAGGAGTRMNSEIPKQFLPVLHLPVLMHTIHVFHTYDSTMEIMVILPEDQINTWETLCKTYHFTIRHQIGTGGETRFHSVKKNLNGINDNSLIAVHDGVRPLVSYDTISRCFNAALEYGNAVPCIQIPETLRIIKKNSSVQVDRTNYRLIQTPQVFHAAILKAAYQLKYRNDFTDDAGVVEKAGNTIHLVEGNSENIKITFEKDLLIAASLLKQAGS